MENFQENRKQHGFRFGGGGDDGNNNGFFAKTTIYSKQCFNDPENPGKLICKETNQSSNGFNPFSSNFNQVDRLNNFTRM
jgi:hypothetical protein